MARDVATLLIASSKVLGPIFTPIPTIIEEEADNVSTTDDSKDLTSVDNKEIDNL
ncbi:MAG: hypothetical protein HXL21_00775 [Peptostreptococcus sp.]|uniref:hypothetical protein n=1 Tax=Peptostreptococcus sp. TaxID=1262 RepID=UPI001CAE1663|nr:hypothetical protein [Peptostreptococcus sp.]MBF1043908.1 hypothetical protein [Peptostreptococcus sp.]